MNEKNRKIITILLITFCISFTAWSLYDGGYDDGFHDGTRYGVAFNKCMTELGGDCTPEIVENIYYPREENIFVYMYPISVSLNCNKTTVCEKTDEFFGPTLEIQTDVWHSNDLRFVIDNDTILTKDDVRLLTDKYTNSSVYIQFPKPFPLKTEIITMYYGHFYRNVNYTYDINADLILSSYQVNEIAFKDDDGNLTYWIENYNKKLVWILLPDKTQIKACVYDIDNLNDSCFIIDDFCITPLVWKEQNITVDYISVKETRGCQ